MIPTRERFEAEARAWEVADLEIEGGDEESRIIAAACHIAASIAEPDEAMVERLADRLALFGMDRDASGPQRGYWLGQARAVIAALREEMGAST